MNKSIIVQTLRTMIRRNKANAERAEAFANGTGETLATGYARAFGVLDATVRLDVLDAEWTIELLGEEPTPLH